MTDFVRDGAGLILGGAGWERAGFLSDRIRDWRREAGPDGTAVLLDAGAESLLSSDYFAGEPDWVRRAASGDVLDAGWHEDDERCASLVAHTLGAMWYGWDDALGETVRRGVTALRRYEGDTRPVLSRLPDLLSEEGGSDWSDADFREYLSGLTPELRNRLRAVLQVRLGGLLWKSRGDLAPCAPAPGQSLLLHLSAPQDGLTAAALRGSLFLDRLCRAWGADGPGPRLLAVEGFRQLKGVDWDFWLDWSNRSGCVLTLSDASRRNGLDAVLADRLDWLVAFCLRSDRDARAVAGYLGFSGSDLLDLRRMSAGRFVERRRAAEPVWSCLPGRPSVAA